VRAPTPPLKLEKIRFFGVKSWFFTRNTPNIFAPPSAIGKNKIFWRKIVIFHTKYPKNFSASLRPPGSAPVYERGKVWTYTMLFEARPTLFFKFKSMLISNPLIYLKVKNRGVSRLLFTCSLSNHTYVIGLDIHTGNSPGKHN
jgi:hypothetical protein